MLNFRYKFFSLKKQTPCGYIHIILTQFKSEYSQLVFKPHVFQYNVKSKLYLC